MNHRERVLSALSREGYDRIPVRHEAEPVVNSQLMAFFGVSDELSLLDCLGDDLRSIQPVYLGPKSRLHPDGTIEFGWPTRLWPVGARYRYVEVPGGAYAEVVHRPFEGIEDPDELDRFTFPSPDWFDYSTIKAQCQRWGDYARYHGKAGVLDFMNSLSHVRGMENVLMGIAVDDPVLLKLMDIKFKFHLEMVERVLKAAEGLIDIVYCGEDLGTQLAPIISPRSFDRLFAPKFGEFFDMVHRYGAKTMMHSCGSVRPLLPRLIEIGLDILQVVQVSAANMDLRELHAEFGSRLNFCSSMCVQTTLINGTVQDVEREVLLRLELFRDGGLILGPSHAIQPSTPLANILAMYRTAGSLAS
ncbi:MAG: uroporphyrinogen decarboxylase family protein [Chloroflexota bacterium]|jgi:uroporphyrinogen decarboxylase